MYKISHFSKTFFASATLLILLLASGAFAQTEAEATEAFAKGALLLKANRFKDAIPYMAIAAKGFPEDPDVRTGYGLALTFGSKQTDDAAEGKRFAEQALVEFQAAKRLGAKDPQIDVFIGLLSGNTSGLQSSSGGARSPGEKYMQEAESLFAQSKYAEAVKMYQKALDADPKLYEAPLYIGDAYVSMQDWDNAEKAYQKAIAIDPSRETAYRYSATPFMKQKKYDLARDRYIEAYITDPYDERAQGGISQWASVTGAKLGHPKVDFPKAASQKEGDPWNAYFMSRSDSEKAAAPTRPGEKSLYRHSLSDEAKAIRAMLKAAGSAKNVDPQIEILRTLEAEGLLEAFILMAKADQGIAEDHAGYLKDNRPRLRQYVLNYVIRK